MENGKNPRVSITRLANAQAPPCIIPQVEVRYMNWNMPRRIFPRPFITLALKPSRVRTPDEAAASIRQGNAFATHKTPIRWY